MSPLAHLLLACVALHAAHAASIADSPYRGRVLPGILADEAKPPHVVESAPEINDQTTVLEDTAENNLRVKPADIPVEVVVEDAHTAIKSNEVADDDEEIKRPAVDLRNPGPPQRQEHETQSADHFPNAQEKLAAVRDTLLQTQDLLRHGVKEVGDDISNWLSTNQQLSAIEQNIHTLRESFAAQIQKLNDAIQSFASPQASKPVKTPEQTPNSADLQEVENRVKILQDDFNKGVRALSEGVSIVAILRAEDDASAAAQPTPAAPAASAPSPSAPGQNFLTQFMQGFEATITNSFNQLTSTVNSFMGRPSSNPPAGVQADTPDGTTQRPWPTFQLPNFLNFTNIINGGQQHNQTSAPAGGTPGFVQGIQSTFQGFFSGLRPGVSSTAKPSEAGSNSVPEKPTGEKQPETPAAAAIITAAPAPDVGGPIRQILSNNPVVQGIAGTVQRIQSSISNPEKPRDTEKNDDPNTKGGFYGGPRPGGSGDNHDVDGLKQLNEDVKEIKKEPEVVDNKETNTDMVLEKTE